MSRFPYAAFAVLFFCACSSPYLKNRGRDGLDIATFTLETHSYGTALRAGPVKAGLNYHSAKGSAFGLRGGDAGAHNSEEITVFFAGRDIFRKSAPAAENETEEALPPDEQPDSEAPSENETAEKPDLAAQRGKTFAAFSPIGTTLPAYKKRSVLKSTAGLAPAYYYTQIEFTVGLFFGIRVGLNPGELFDAIAGIFTFDPFSDDEPFQSAEERALMENPAYKSLSDEQKKLLREQLQKKAP